MTDLAYALAAHANGYAVVPPAEDGSKRPAGTWKAYQDNRPTPEQIKLWYERGRAGFGVLCGAASGNLEMFELEGRAINLWQPFQEACRDAGLGDLLKRITDGYAERTPSDGIHLLTRCPDGIEGNLKLARRSATPHELEADPHDKIKVLIETRGEGGYTILAPSCGAVHPTGKAWRLIKGGLDTVAVITGDERAAFLAVARSFDQLDPPPPKITAETFFNVATGGGWFDEVVDNYNRSTTWDQVLDGWTRDHTDAKGITYWTRPGKEARHGHSATTNSLGTDRLIVFSSSVDGFDVYDGTGRATSYDRFSVHAILHHHGDLVAAGRALRGDYGPSGTASASAGPPSDPELTGDWEPVDLAAYFEGTIEPPKPTILVPVGSEHGLIYPGRVSSLFGESGSGKTWIALAAIASVIRSSGNAILIDLEDSAAGTVARLIALGLTADDILPHFSYIGPETAWRPDAAVVFDTVIERTNPELVVIDSTGEAMAAGGIKGNDDDDVARWFAVFPKAIARLGPAVLILDHIPKDPNAPTAYALGSQRKRAAINGASYRVDAIKSPSRDHDGLLKIVTAKDRHGWHTQGRTASMVKLIHLAGAIDLTLTVEEGPEGEGPFRPTHLMESVSRWLELHPDQSKSAIKDAVKGKNAYLVDAVDRLVEEGFVTKTTAPRGDTYRVEKRFREDDDTLTELTRSHPFPPVPVPGGNGSPEDPFPVPSPTGERERVGPTEGPSKTVTRSQPTGTDQPQQPRFPTDVETDF